MENFLKKILAPAGSKTSGKNTVRLSKLNVPAAKLPPHRDQRDFRSSMSWRMFRVMAEFVEGWEFVADLRKSVTVFGSARAKEGSRWYEEARQLGRALAESGIAVVTGGGPGVMEGSNRGARENGGESVGLNIQLPMEQRTNPYVQKSKAFHYFFTRKVMLTYAAEAYVYFPGGFGTLDEFFEIVTLIQTKEISQVPVILFGREFWQPFAEWIDRELNQRFGHIDPIDTKIYQIVDSAEEAMKIIRRAPLRDEFYDHAHKNQK